MTRGTAMRIASTVTLGLLLLSGLWIGVFFLTGLLYGAIGYAPPFLVQVINSLLGLLVSALF